jgi:hypothetical protein
VSKSDTPVANTVVAKSEPGKTETDVTFTNFGESKSAIEKPSVFVVETSSVADKTAVTSESENKAISPIDSGSSAPVSAQQPVVTTESSSSITGVGGAIVSDTPKTSDSAVVTDNNSRAIAVNPTSSTSPNSVAAENSVSNVTGDNGGAIAPSTEANTQTTVVEIVASQGEVTGASNPISQNNNSVAVSQPLVNQLLEEARQELIKLKQEQGEELSQFASELTQKINNLNQVSQNLWTDINTAHGSSYEALINIKSSLDRTQPDLNQLSGTILSAEGKMGQQLSAFQNLIDSSERNFNNNSLHSSIQGANQKVINLSNSLWNDLYPKRTNYSSVWQQVEGIYNSRNEPTNQYNALLSDGKAVFDNARSQYNSLSQSKNIAISEDRHCFQKYSAK